MIIVIIIITIVIILIPSCQIQYVHLLPFLEGAKCVLLSYSLCELMMSFQSKYILVCLYELHVFFFFKTVYLIEMFTKGY